MKVLIEEVNVHSDNRGVVFEPIQADEFKTQRNAHVVISHPGVVRGNHYHKIGTEIIAVSGPAIVRIRENKTVQNIEVPDNSVFRFTIPPKISHAIQNTSKETNVLMAFNTMEHDPENPDTVQDILIPFG